MSKAALPAPDLSGKPSWQPITLPALMTNPNSFVSGDPEGNRLRLKYYYIPDEDRLVAQTWFGPAVEGPPKHVHGGCIAAVLDESMGMSALYAGHTAVAANISFDLIKMVPLQAVASAYAWVSNVEGKKVYTEAELVSADGIVYAKGRGLFITIGFSKIAALAR